MSADPDVKYLAVLINDLRAELEDSVGHTVELRRRDIEQLIEYADDLYQLLISD